VTVTGHKTGVRIPENEEISTFFYSAQANDRKRPVHPLSTWETLKAVKAQGLNLIHLHPVTKVTNALGFTSTLVTSNQPHGSYLYVNSLFDDMKQF
jgi:hypothetical protein